MNEVSPIFFRRRLHPFQTSKKYIGEANLLERDVKMIISLFPRGLHVDQQNSAEGFSSLLKNWKQFSDDKTKWAFITIIPSKKDYKN